MVRPYLIEMVNGLSTNPVDAFKRNTLRTFQTSEIPEEVEGELFDHCIEYLKSMDEAIAIKAFGMTVARRICERYPELADEVILPVEILISENYSAGVVNRGKKELKKLLKLRESIS
jgi:predicted transcriptional regulator